LWPCSLAIPRAAFSPLTTRAGSPRTRAFAAPAASRPPAALFSRRTRALAALVAVVAAVAAVAATPWLASTAARARRATPTTDQSSPVMAAPPPHLRRHRLPSSRWLRALCSNRTATRRELWLLQFLLSCRSLPTAPTRSIIATWALRNRCGPPTSLRLQAAPHRYRCRAGCLCRRRHLPLARCGLARRRPLTRKLSLTSRSLGSSRASTFTGCYKRSALPAPPSPPPSPSPPLAL
jgi:hypothetical protein